MSEYVVEAKSRADLRMLARQFRICLHLENVLYFPIVELLDVLPEIFPSFSYEVAPDDAFPHGTHADTDICTGHVRIRESVYNGACDGNGRDRMTIAHEIAHYFMLCVCGFRLQRNFSEEKLPAYYDPEWQAKCFAGELMVADHLCNSKSPYEIAALCGGSDEAASFQYRSLRKGADAV